jgi:hypothetical protein
MLDDAIHLSWPTSVWLRIPNQCLEICFDIVVYTLLLLLALCYHIPSVILQR